MLIFAIIRHIIHYGNSHKYNNTCVYGVGTKLNMPQHAYSYKYNNTCVYGVGTNFSNSYGTKLKYITIDL